MPHEEALIQAPIRFYVRIAPVEGASRTEKRRPGGHWPAPALVDSRPAGATVPATLVPPRRFPVSGIVILLVVVGILVLVGLIFAGMYNGLVKLRNKVENAWAQIDVQIKRRYDLIPNLVETVKGYATHEKETLERVVQARNMAMAASGPQEQAQAENMISGALKSIFALSEAYPDLKANTNFLNLQEELTTTEDRISYSRQYYNDTVNRYNTKIQTFPTVFLANMFGFEQREYFEADGEARGPVSVSF